MSWAAIKWARKQQVGSASAKAVLICLAFYADDTGYCWPSQETIAGETEISVDSVQRALKHFLVSKLVERIKRKSSDGRRISDGYKLKLQTDPCSVEGRSDVRGTASCGKAGNVRQAGAATVAEPQSDTLRDGTVRPKSIKKEVHEYSACPMIDTPGGRRLEKKIGTGSFRSWFGKTRHIGQEGQLLLLEAPTRVVARKIEQWYDADVVECFQPELGEIRGLKVIVAIAVEPSDV